MKFTFALILVVLSVCVFDTITAASSSRQKRSVAHELCPENSSDEACRAYAAERAKGATICQTYHVGGGSIEWQSCGTVACGGNAKLVPEDLSKPYPQCCERCE